MTYSEARRNAIAATRRTGYIHSVSVHHEDGFTIRKCPGIYTTQACEVDLGHTVIEWELGGMHVRFAEHDFD